MPPEKPIYEDLESRVENLTAELREYKLSEKTLRESLLEYKSIFDYAGDSVFIIDPETGSFVNCNAKAAERLGYTRDELLQLKVYDINKREIRPDIRQRIKKQLAGESIQFETTHRHKSGRAIPVEITSTMVEINNRKILMAFARDITIRKNKEVATEDLVQHLQLALDEITTLQAFIPICASCKKIRNDQELWENIEDYFQDHLEVEFTHCLCPACAKKLYPEYY